MSSRALYGIYESLDDCLLLYRYELANDLKVKFGINDLSKLMFHFYYFTMSPPRNMKGVRAVLFTMNVIVPSITMVFIFFS
jgi:hypothetical protein